MRKGSGAKLYNTVNKYNLNVANTLYNRQNNDKMNLQPGIVAIEVSGGNLTTFQLSISAKIGSIMYKLKLSIIKIKTITHLKYGYFF